jgi:hypothetical protein
VLGVTIGSVATGRIMPHMPPEAGALAVEPVAGAAPHICALAGTTHASESTVAVKARELRILVSSVWGHSNAFNRVRGDTSLCDRRVPATARKFGIGRKETLEVRCPKCGAWRGYLCFRKKEGSPRRKTPHIERYAAAVHEAGGLA